jgi:hypothetical protein
MACRILAGFLLACLSLLAPRARPAAHEGTACGDLTGLTIPGLVVNAATVVPAGPFIPPDAKIAHAPRLLPRRSHGAPHQRL